MMGDSELQELSRDIAKNGLLEPISIFDGMILDGRNRLKACELAGVTPRFETLDHIESPTIYVVSKNYHRRHLTVSQRAAIGAGMVPLLQGEAKQRQRDHANTAPGRPKTLVLESTQVMERPSGKVRDIAAKAVGVSGFSVQKALGVQKADPELFESVKRGEVTLLKAANAVEEKREPTKRQLIIENAHRQRMIDGLSMVNGACRGLLSLNFSAIRDGCAADDIATWAKMANDCAKQLREFARKITDEQTGEVKAS